MGRKDDLERGIRDSYKIIRQYEEIVQTSDRPEERARAWRKMEEQREHISGYLAQYNPLCQALKRTPPEDIAEIIVIASIPFPEPDSSDVSAEAAIPARDTPTYHLVDIRIFDTTSEENGHPIELTVPGGRDFPRGQLQLDKSALLALSADSETYGRTLGEALFAEEAIGDAYQETLAVFQSQGDQVRVRLRLDSPALHDVRWERVYHPIAGSWYPLTATADTLLSRYVPVQAWGQPKPLAVRPLRTLVVLASPSNLDEYNLSDISDNEFRTWHAVFDNLPDIEVTYLQTATTSPPTLNSIRQALLDGYHVVHFVCHGAKKHRGTVLYLEDDSGLVEPVRAGRILEAFRALTTRPHLCFLAACESGSRGSTDGFIPLGPALVAEGGVPAVVAMAERVGIVTARQFAHQFYDRVLAHGVVDLAVHQARAMVRERWDWSVPVLFSRLPDNQLFEPHHPTLAKVQKPLPGLSTLNPFGTMGRITDPDRFFGREELLRQIFEELGKGTNLSLVGESQVGKSSLLSMVCALGPERIDLPPEAFAYLSLEWVDDEDDFYEALCEALSVETCRGYKLTRALRGKQHILCLDEMEKMTWDGFTVRVRSQLRGLADGPAAPLRLVIASRSPLAHLFPDSPELDSPLAGICHQLDVGPFPPDVAHVFLAHRLQGTGVTFTESEIITLIAQTGGHPAKLQRTAADLYNVKRET